MFHGDELNGIELFKGVALQSLNLTSVQDEDTDRVVYFVEGTFVSDFQLYDFKFACCKRV
jgi:hypothetical protein